jgi:uncharacterized membrane-anchored protein
MNMTALSTTQDSKYFPREDAMRLAVHNEILGRPPARMGLPVQIACLVVLNADVDLEAEIRHLALLPGQKDLTATALQTPFLRIQVGACTLKWERHAEFTAYSVMRALPPSTLLNDPPQQLLSQLLLEDDWLRNIPGHTLGALHLVMLLGDPPSAVTRAAAYDHWFATGAAVASQMGTTVHSSVVTDFAVQDDGFERILVLAATGMSEGRVGRVAQRLLEIEIYRLMALRSLPAAQQLGIWLEEAEQRLVGIHAQINGELNSNQDILHALALLSADVERAVANHRRSFDASKAYHALVTQRLTELREKPIPGTQTLGEFMHRRLSPAIATVASTGQRLEALSTRVAHTSALLRTRVEVTLESQGRVALDTLASVKLLLSRVQRTLQVLSIAATTFFVVQLLLHIGHAVQRGGFALDPELWVGALVPVALGSIWWLVHRINQRIQAD